MVFSFTIWKVDYEDGEKWSKVPFRFAELKGLLNDWRWACRRAAGGMRCFGIIMISRAHSTVLVTFSGIGRNLRPCWRP